MQASVVEEMDYQTIVFFFNHKMAYELRIIDWRSDVCSSDLGNWSNQLQTLPYYNNHTVQQINGSLTVKGVRFRRSFASAIRIDGASLTTDADCRFVEGATHDNAVDNPRISHYIACYADAEIGRA